MGNPRTGAFEMTGDPLLFFVVIALVIATLCLIATALPSGDE